MKTRYLILNEGKLVLSNYKEWKQITRENRELPTEEKRHFIFDDIVENGEHDRIVYEVSYAEYKEWHKEQSMKRRMREYSSDIEVLSLEYELNEKGSFGDLIKDSLYSESVWAEMLLRQLKEDLSKWNKWALEMLEVLLRYEESEIYDYYESKYGMNRKAVYYRKEKLEAYIRKYLKED